MSFTSILGIVTSLVARCVHFYSTYTTIKTPTHVLTMSRDNGSAGLAVPIELYLRRISSISFFWPSVRACAGVSQNRGGLMVPSDFLLCQGLFGSVLSAVVLALCIHTYNTVLRLPLQVLSLFRGVNTW